MESQLLQLLTQAAGQVALGDCEGLFERAASGVKASTGVKEGYLYGDSFAGESSDSDVAYVSQHLLETGLFPRRIIHQPLYLTNSLLLLMDHVESVLLQLTSLLMEGRAGLKVFIDTIYTDILQVQSLL